MKVEDRVLYDESTGSFKLLDMHGFEVEYRYDIAGPKYTRVYGKPLAKLLEDFTVTVLRQGKVVAEITAKAGFEFDGASVPRIFWGFTTPFDMKTIVAALIHDWLYGKLLLTRKVADEIFRDLLVCELNRWFKIGRMYWAVDKFGGMVWGDGVTKRTRMSRMLYPKWNNYPLDFD